jgi:hypothetical protein
MCDGGRVFGHANQPRAVARREVRAPQGHHHRAVAVPVFSRAPKEMFGEPFLCRTRSWHAPVIFTAMTLHLSFSGVDLGAELSA